VVLFPVSGDGGDSGVHAWSYSGVLWWGGSVLMALFWYGMVCCGGLGLFCSCCWKLLQVGLVVGGIRLVGFGFGKTATLLVRGGGGEQSCWSNSVSELFVLGISPFSFSKEPSWTINTSLQSFSQPRF
jgi:hypothetical protein